MDTRYEDIAADHQLQYGFCCFTEEIFDNKINIKAHWHDYIELLYFENGRANIYLNGKLYKAEAGDLIIINSREAHRIESSDKYTEYKVIQFDPDMLHMSSTVFTLKYILPFSGSDKNYPRLFKNEDLISTNIEQKIKDIYNESEQENYAYELAVQGNIIMLFLDIVRSWYDVGIDISSDTYIKKRDVAWLRMAISFIEDNYNQEISAKQAAKLCSMSYNYFTARFKKVLGRSFSRHLNFVRLRQSEYQLISTDNSITNIAYDSGFSSTSYFISLFVKYKGITPQNYRKQIKATKLEGSKVAKN